MLDRDPLSRARNDGVGFFIRKYADVAVFAPWTDCSEWRWRARGEEIVSVDLATAERFLEGN